MARNTTLRKAVDIEGRRVTWTNAAGENVGELIYDHLTEEMKLRLALHGIAQKGGDSYSGLEGEKAMVEALTLTLGNLSSGKWGVERAAGGGAAANRTVEALTMALGIDLAAATELYDSMDDATRKAIRKTPEIQQALAEIRAKKAKASAPSLADLVAAKNA